MGSFLGSNLLRPDQARFYGGAQMKSIAVNPVITTFDCRFGKLSSAFAL